MGGSLGAQPLNSMVRAVGVAMVLTADHSDPCLRGQSSWLRVAVAVEVPGLVRGVAPSDQAKYSGNSFQCMNAVSAGLPPLVVDFAAVNDDFCDCPDGSDEPGTGACAGSEQTLFFCPNAQSAPRYVYLSRINDGICDCCDGSDEWRSAASHSAPMRGTPCPNTCAEEGLGLERERKRKEADLRAGIKTRRRLIKDARADVAKSAKELEGLKANLPALEAEEKKAIEKWEAAKKVLQEENARLKAANASQAKANPTTAPTPRPTPSPPQTQAPTPPPPPPRRPPSETEAPAQPPAVEAVSGDSEGPVVSEYAKWMEGVEEKASSSAPASGAATTTETNSKVVSEYTKWMEGAEEAIGDGDGTADEEAEAAAEVEELDSDTDAMPPTEEAPMGPEEPGFLGKAWDRVRGSFHSLWERMFGKKKSHAERAKEAAEKAKNEAAKKVRESRKKIEELEKKVARNSTHEELAFAGLDGKCITKKLTDYKYEVCFFNTAKQDNTLIGKFKRWEAPGVASFEDGLFCPGGPARSLKVQFQCGPKEEILEVGEPSRCAYQASATHPAACTEESLKALETQGPRRPTDEL